MSPDPRALAGTPARAEAPGTTTDELDVVVAVRSESPWLLAAQRAALDAALGPQWTGGALVVDDAARPATARAAQQSLAAHHPRARRTILRLPRRAGLAAAATLALAEATGEYVALLDGRTRPEPHALEALVAALDETPDALWAAPPSPGAVLVRREASLAIGAFDPELRPGAAARDAAARAVAAGWRLLVVDGARVRHEPAPRRASLPRPAPARPWSAAALEAWLPRARLRAVRIDL
jgi:hypothetical protein